MPLFNIATLFYGIFVSEEQLSSACQAWIADSGARLFIDLVLARRTASTLLVTGGGTRPALSRVPPETWSHVKLELQRMNREKVALRSTRESTLVEGYGQMITKTLESFGLARPQTDETQTFWGDYSDDRPLSAICLPLVETGYSSYPALEIYRDEDEERADEHRLLQFSRNVFNLPRDADYRFNRLCATLGLRQEVPRDAMTAYSPADSQGVETEQEEGVALSPEGYSAQDLLHDAVCCSSRTRTRKTVIAPHWQMWASTYPSDC